MRTSPKQFSIMVDFMEKNKDITLNKGPEDRLHSLMKWKELTDMLNDEMFGEQRTPDKWRKVWSDLKANTRRKWLKLHRPEVFGPTQSFSDLEIRVLTIMGCIGRINKPIREIDITGDTTENSNCGARNTIEVKQDPDDPSFFQVHTIDEEESRPGCSSLASEAGTPQESRSESPVPIRSSTPPESIRSPTPVSHAPSPQPEVQPDSPPRPKKRRRVPCSRPMLSVDYLLRSEKLAREEARERDRLFAELERERIRQRDVELRQRDAELLLQGQWLDFMRAGLSVLEKYLDKK